MRLYVGRQAWHSRASTREWRLAINSPLWWGVVEFNFWDMYFYMDMDYYIYAK